MYNILCLSFKFPYHSILFGAWSFKDEKIKIILYNLVQQEPCSVFPAEYVEPGIQKKISYQMSTRYIYVELISQQQQEQLA